ncbi:hypothetical protein HK104_011228 [Borealophlyctis nickersoniae]|nr:hypothetical protein HK104_011228 [Borealophlyctis nickersoniae]
MLFEPDKVNATASQVVDYAAILGQLTQDASHLFNLICDGDFLMETKGKSGAVGLPSYPAPAVYDRLFRGFIKAAVATRLFFPLACAFGVFTTAWAIGGGLLMAIIYGPPKLKQNVKALSLDEDSEYGKHEYVTANGLTFHYVLNGPSKPEGGKRPLLLFIHGFPECWYTWRHQLKYFSEKYNAVAIDLRGYGLSDKPAERAAYTRERVGNDIKCIIKELGYDRATVVGHDWGGGVAWALALDFPEVVSSLILINISNFHQILYRKATLRAYWGFRTFSSDEDAEFYRRSILLPGAARGGVNFYRNMLNGNWGRLDQMPPKVQAKTLIIWGQGDPFLDEQNSLEGIDAFFLPNKLSVVMVPSGGHFVPETEPNAVNQHIGEFLREN